MLNEHDDLTDQRQGCLPTNAQWCGRRDWTASAMTVTRLRGGGGGGGSASPDEAVDTQCETCRRCWRAESNRTVLLPRTDAVEDRCRAVSFDRWCMEAASRLVRLGTSSCAAPFKGARQTVMN